VNTEITDKNVNRAKGWIFFDAECRFCVAGRRRWGRTFERRGFVWLPLQSPGTAERLGITHDQLMTEMWVLPVHGQPINGVGSWIELMRHVWWLWPLAFFLGLPGINHVGQVVYRWVARNRYCIAGRCEVKPKQKSGLHLHELLILVMLTTTILIVTRTWPSWIFMWTLGITLGQFGKWLTWRDARMVGLATPLHLSLIWFLLWPGLDSRAFFNRETAIPRPALAEWSAAVTKLALGIGLTWWIAPRLSPINLIAAGWVAMTGIILCLHFGLFHLLALAWRTAGVNAQPIMNHPFVATSLAEFWGERWNAAFSIPARRFLFNPLARRHGIIVATLAVFLASGLLHELVISVPADAGYGLPTAYFALQGTGILFERSKVGRSLGLGRGWRGWLFTLAMTAAPAFWLFHPQFIHNVILPMLQAIGAT
jgi:alginate O-acetyltransferase complex protein AlgI